MTASTPSPAQTVEMDPSAARPAHRAALLMLAAAGVYTLYSTYLAIRLGAWPVIAQASVMWAYCAFTLAALLLSRRGQAGYGMQLMIGALHVTVVLISGLIAGLGPAMAAIAVTLTAGVAAQTLTGRAAARAIGASGVAALIALALDLFAPLGYRARVPALQLAAPLIAGALALGYAALIARQFASYSLRTKLLIAFLAVALLPLAVLAFVNDRSTRASLTASANEALLAAAAQTAANLDAFISNTLNSTFAEAQLPQFRQYLGMLPEERPTSPLRREVADLLQVLTNKDSRIFSYLLLDANGQVVASNATLDIGADMSGREYYQVPFKSMGAYVSAVDFSSGAEAGLLYFASPVRGSNLRTVGVLVVRYRARILQDLVVQNNNLAGADSFGVLFDEYRVHLAHGTGAETIGKSVDRLPPDRLAALQAAGRLPGLSAEALSTNLPALDANLANAAAMPFFTARDVATGDKINQVAVASLGTQPWSVAFFQPQEVFLTLAEAQSRRTLLLSVLVTALVAGAALGVAQLLAGPIARLTAVAVRVTEGDLSARAAVEARDETGTLAATFNSMTARLQQTLAGLEQRVAERTAQLQAAADIGRATTSVRDSEGLMQLALQLIRERFGFYHASIFLMDHTGQMAVLRESTGEIGMQLKARGHRLAVGSQSLIGWVTQYRRPRVALDVAGDPFHFKNPLLPDTRSELAIPLIVGERLIGALDVQSTDLHAFSESDVQVLQTLAAQLSVAIENAELFQSTQASYAEVSARYQKVAGTGWRSLLAGQARERVFPLGPEDAKDGAPTDEAPVEIPLRLHGEVVGTIELHGRPGGGLTPEEQAAIDTAAAQLSIALESAALFEEAQNRSRREQLINTVTYQMRSTLNPAAIMQSGIRELGKALGATEVVVQLHKPTRARTTEAPTEDQG